MPLRKVDLIDLGPRNKRLFVDGVDLSNAVQTTTVRVAPNSVPMVTIDLHGWVESRCLDAEVVKIVGSIPTARELELETALRSFLTWYFSSESSTYEVDPADAERAADLIGFNRGRVDR